MHGSPPASLPPIARAGCRTRSSTASQVSDFDGTHLDDVVKSSTSSFVDESDVFDVASGEDPDVGFLLREREGLKPTKRKTFPSQLVNGGAKPRRQSERRRFVECRNVTFDEERPFGWRRHLATVKRARVTYKVRAVDAVDGPVRVACAPKSGSRFKIGRTRVGCSAVDQSGNEQTATFTVIVKARR
jgi:hypothetical protein